MLAGSAVNRASCQSPTASKNSPTAQTAMPSTVTTSDAPDHSGPSWCTAACTGRETNHMAAAWVRYTRRYMCSAGLPVARAWMSA